MRVSAFFSGIKTGVFLFASVIVFNQQSYSQEIDRDYFRSPLGIDLYLSGDFCELRKNHFHTGLDIKCNGASGYKIYAAADGYLGRIKVGHYGYGRVLYINHPNGLTTVYAHQSKFNDELEKYVREQQYLAQNDQIDIYPDSTLFTFKKGDVIGYTGNSGTSSGAHLHFEIRRTKDDHPLNPWRWNFPIKDEIAPTIYGIKIYPLNDTSTVNGLNKPAILKATASGGKYILSQPVKAYGFVGFAVHTIDMTNGSGNQCGPYSIELCMENDTVFRTVFDEISFETSRYINAHMDYLAYRDLENSYHKSFIKGVNELPIYTHRNDNGWIGVLDKNKKNMKFVVKDINGNKSVLDFTVEMQKTNLKPAAKNCSKEIKWNEESIFENEEIKITFSDSSLYDDVCFDYSMTTGAAGYYASIHKLHDDDIPIMHPIELKIKTNLTDTSLANKLTGIFINEKGSISGEGGEYKEGYMVWTTKTFGKYSVMMDTKPPVISPSLVYEGKLMGKGTTMKFSLADNLTGIKKYNAFIDGKWVLGILDPFKKVLTIDLDAENIGPGEHSFELKAEDGCANESVYSCKFTR